MDLFRKAVPVLLSLLLVFLSACASRSGPEVYHDPNFDLASVRIVAVMPFENLTKETLASSRVRDVFMNMLLSTGAIYVLPAGEVARGMVRAGIEKATAPLLGGCRKTGGHCQGRRRHHGGRAGVRRGALEHDDRKRRFPESSDDRDADRKGGMDRVLHQGRHNRRGPALWRGGAADGRRHPGGRHRRPQ